MSTIATDSRTDVIKQSICLHGAILTPSSLVITKADASTFAKVGRHLQTVEACRSWWWGDYLVQYCKWKLDQKVHNRPVGPAEREAYFVHYTAEFAELAGVDEGTLRNWRMISSFYEVACRQDNLSWSHHWEAWAGSAGDVKVALGWLQQAKEEEWSKTDLRAAIRAGSHQEAGTPEAPVIRLQEAIAFSRWARTITRQVSDLKPAEARAIRDDLKPAVDLYQQLNARLGEGVS